MKRLLAFLALTVVSVVGLMPQTAFASYAIPYQSGCNTAYLQTLGDRFCIDMTTPYGAPRAWLYDSASHYVAWVSFTTDSIPSYWHMPGNWIAYPWESTMTTPPNYAEVYISSPAPTGTPGIYFGLWIDFQTDTCNPEDNYHAEDNMCITSPASYADLFAQYVQSPTAEFVMVN